MIDNDLGSDTRRLRGAHILTIQLVTKIGASLGPFDVSGPRFESQYIDAKD